MGVTLVAQRPTLLHGEHDILGIQHPVLMSHKPMLLIY